MKKQGYSTKCLDFQNNDENFRIYVDMVKIVIIMKGGVAENLIKYQALLILLKKEVMECIQH